MLKIRALNRDSSSDEDGPVIRREAQEAIALELYNDALRLQAKDSLKESETILLNLINENIPQLENNGGLPKSMSTLKYSCYMNVANIYLQLGEDEKALENYLIASELDGTDVTLWHKIGKLSLKLNEFKQSAYAFSKGLECSESHWPCLDNLITVLFALRDTINCLDYIGKGLMLDENYTKGLVLRRQIYRDNPATKDYYQLYNPDHIWEPSFDVEIDAKDEERFLKEADELTNRIIEAEKALGPKKLSTIPLPKALDNYSWLSVAETIVHLHKYLSEQGMSHFTFIDLSKCMSQSNEAPTEPPSQVSSVENSVANEKNELEENNSEKMEVDEPSPPPERRYSMTSETNNEENTPNQTDNDEEQVNDQEDQEMEDVSENPEKESNKSLNESKNNRQSSGSQRGTKRRRDLVSELQIWGWHSKRKYKKGKQDKDFSVEDAFNRIIPKSLLKSKMNEGELKSNDNEDSMNTMDIYNIYVDERNVNCVSPIHSPQSINYEPYFDTDREKDDVLQFWTKNRSYCDAVVLIKDLVMHLSKLWHLKWPKDLINLYLEAYQMFLEHCDIPDAFSDEYSFSDIRDYALATLLCGELQIFSSDKDLIHGSLISFLEMVVAWQDHWKDEFLSVFIRFYWFKMHIFRRDDENDLAIRSLMLISDYILEEEEKSKEKYLLYLPNCSRCNLVTLQIVEKILKHLELISCLSTIEDLYNNKKYKEAADIVKTTFDNSTIHPQVGRLGRPAQLAILIHSLWYIDMSECFIWTEECLHEGLSHFLKSDGDDKWEKIIEKCLVIFHEIIKKETICIVDSLDEERRIRLVESLTKIIRKQLSVEHSNKIQLGCVTPWILLHYILLREEHRQHAGKKTNHIKTDKCEEDPDQINKEEELPPSVAVLFSAHEFLGPKGWCLTNHGELLHFILDSVLDRLDTPVFENLREKLDIHIEQAMFCLYQHPSKKNKISRHLADHNVDPLPLTWERAFQLYEFYGPGCLPEFDSYKNVSISSDLEQLLKRIIALVPTENDPQLHLQKILDFVCGKTEEMPPPIQFPNKVRAIYYLIGDFYFKQREFQGCLKYFQMDLCINPDRLDSWACMGLSYVSQLESTLNYCEKIASEAEFLKKAKSAQICFKKSLDLVPTHLTLWIEFGTFEYMLHSFCSRALKFDSENFNMDQFEMLENQKNEFLDSSCKSFEKAITLYELDETEQDERWLQYYILGKIAEKKRKEPVDYLPYYVTASTLLHENNAVYPEKINYYNPQHLSVEALELHYRIHASILKYLELHENKDISNTLGAFFKKCLDATDFLKQSTQSKKPAKANLKSDSELDNNIKKDVKECLESVLNQVQIMVESDGPKNTEDKSKNESKVSTTEKSTAEDVIILDSDDELQKKELKSAENVKKENVKENVEAATENRDEKPSKQKTEKKTKADNETDTDNVRTSIEETTTSDTSSSSSSSSSSESDSDEEESSSSSSSSSSESENMSNAEVLQLIDRCIEGLELCVIRLPQNYKALYRLAHLYFNYKSKKDLTKCRQLLLGEYKCKDGSTINGLFSDRKINNFFNGIWRIPSTEIDRPGSLAAHMSRCISLLLQILRATSDNKILIELCVQLRKTPDPDKIYIRDSERIQFAEQAMTMCTQSFKVQMKDLPNMENAKMVKLLQEIYRIHQRVQKHIPLKDNVFATMLADVYKQFIKEKIPDGVNVLDLAVKFCQQNRPDKPKVSIQSVSAGQIGIPTHLQKIGAASSTNTSSLLAPQQSSTSTGVPAMPPLKRPNLGRPRGRPPLPKLPNQQRSSIPRGRSPSSSQFAWLANNFNKSMFEQSTYTYEYLKHYQDQLLKQYSQSLNLQQMSQMAQYLQCQIPSVSSSLAGSSTASSVASDLLKYNMASLGQQTFTSSSAASSASSMGMVNQLANLSNLNMSKNQMLDAIGKITGLSSKKADSSSNTSRIPSSVANSMDPLKYFGTNLPVTSSTTSLPSTSSLTPAQLSALAQLFPTKRQKSSSSKAGNSSKSKTSTSTKSSSFSTTTSSVKPSTSTTGLFKEPAGKPQQKSVSESAANILMKERPSISIIPVGGHSPSPTSTPPLNNSPQLVSHPNTSPVYQKSPSSTGSSPGKTLQEKLADKQKQIMQKAEISPKDFSLKSATSEADKHSKERSKDVAVDLMKAFNLPNIPATLSVAKQISPTPSTAPTNSSSSFSSKEAAAKLSKFIDLTSATPMPKLPSSLSVTKTTSALPVPVPSFPLDSGISIRQVAPQVQDFKSTKPKQSSKSIHKSKPETKSTDLVIKPPKPQKSTSTEIDLKKLKDIYGGGNISLDQLAALASAMQSSGAGGSSKSESSIKNQKSSSVSSQSKSASTSSGSKGSDLSKGGSSLIRVRKQEELLGDKPPQKASVPAQKTEKRKPSSDDDVICID